MNLIQALFYLLLMSNIFTITAQDSKPSYESDEETSHRFKRPRLHQYEHSDEKASSTTSFTHFALQLPSDQICASEDEALDQFDNIEQDYDQHSEILDDMHADTITVDEHDLERTETKTMFLNFLDQILSPSDDESNENHDFHTHIQNQLTKNHLPIISYVMKHKNDQCKYMVQDWINSQEDSNKNLLHKLFMYPHQLHFFDKIKFLLSLGANPNIQDHEGKTVLHRLQEGYNLVMTIELLKTSKADLNIQDKKGITPLCQAFFKNKPNIMAELLKLGADPTIINDEGNFFKIDDQFFRQVMHQVRSAYCAQHQDKLERKYAMNRQLRQAILDQNILLIKELIAQGADVNFLPAHQFTNSWEVSMQDDNLPNLTLAFEKKINKEVIHILLQAGARVNKRFDQDEVVPLHCAIEELDFESIKMLCAYHAQHVEFYYNNSIHIALGFKGEMDNETDLEDRKSLRLEIIKFLLNHDELQKTGNAARSLIASNVFCITPLQYVVKNNQIDYLKIFLQYSPDLNHIAPEIFQMNVHEIDDLCLDTYDYYIGNSLLHIALKYNYLEIAELLLSQNNINPMQLNRLNQTALDLATTQEMQALLTAHR